MNMNTTYWRFRLVFMIALTDNVCLHSGIPRIVYTKKGGLALSVILPFIYGKTKMGSPRICHSIVFTIIFNLEPNKYIIFIWNAEYNDDINFLKLKSPKIGATLLL